MNSSSAASRKPAQQFITSKNFKTSTMNVNHHVVGNASRESASPTKQRNSKKHPVYARNPMPMPRVIMAPPLPQPPSITATSTAMNEVTSSSILPITVKDSQTIAAAKQNSSSNSKASQSISRSHSSSSSSSSLTLADLPEQEKVKITKLVEKLVAMGHQQEALNDVIKRERTRFENEIEKTRVTFGEQLSIIEDSLLLKDESLAGLSAKQQTLTSILAVYQDRIKDLIAQAKLRDSSEHGLSVENQRMRVEASRLRGLIEEQQEAIDSANTARKRSETMLNSMRQESLTRASVEQDYDSLKFTISQLDTENKRKAATIKALHEEISEKNERIRDMDKLLLNMAQLQHQNTIYASNNNVLKSQVAQLVEQLRGANKFVELAGNISYTPTIAPTAASVSQPNAKLSGRGGTVGVIGANGAAAIPPIRSPNTEEEVNYGDLFGGSVNNSVEMSTDDDDDDAEKEKEEHPKNQVWEGGKKEQSEDGSDDGDFEHVNTSVDSIAQFAASLIASSAPQTVAERVERLSPLELSKRNNDPATKSMADSPIIMPPSSSSLLFSNSFERQRTNEENLVLQQHSSDNDDDGHSKSSVSNSADDNVSNKECGSSRDKENDSLVEEEQRSREEGVHGRQKLLDYNRKGDVIEGNVVAKEDEKGVQHPSVRPPVVAVPKPVRTSSAVPPQHVQALASTEDGNEADEEGTLSTIGDNHSYDHTDEALCSELDGELDDNTYKSTTTASTMFTAENSFFLRGITTHSIDNGAPTTNNNTSTTSSHNNKNNNNNDNDINTPPVVSSLVSSPEKNNKSLSPQQKAMMTQRVSSVMVAAMHSGASPSSPSPSPQLSHNPSTSPSLSASPSRKKGISNSISNSTKKDKKAVSFRSPRRKSTRTATATTTTTSNKEKDMSGIKFERTDSGSGTGSNDINININDSNATSFTSEIGDHILLLNDLSIKSYSPLSNSNNNSKKKTKTTYHGTTDNAVTAPIQSDEPIIHRKNSSSSSSSVYRTSPAVLGTRRSVVEDVISSVRGSLSLSASARKSGGNNNKNSSNKSNNNNNNRSKSGSSSSSNDFTSSNNKHNNVSDNANMNADGDYDPALFDLLDQMDM